MSPFSSKSQAKAAFGGHLGPEMKKKAMKFAHKTNMKGLPEHKPAMPNLKKIKHAK